MLLIRVSMFDNIFKKFNYYVLTKGESAVMYSTMTKKKILTLRWIEVR